jgi:hypothetical protein
MLDVQTIRYRFTCSRWRSVCLSHSTYHFLNRLTALAVSEIGDALYGLTGIAVSENVEGPVVRLCERSEAIQ